MKSQFLMALALTGLATVANAGDASKGENDFKKCRSCHTIANGDDVIFKGGRTGPNLYNVVGRAAGTEDFKYSADMVAAGEGGFVWTEEAIVEFIADPTKYLRQISGNDKARSKMTFKMKGGEDVAAYLASVSPGS